MNNLWFQYGSSAFCLPPKCGGTALYRKLFFATDEIDDCDVFLHALKNTTFVTPYVVSGFRSAVLGVRDPVQRFASLWRDKCRNGDSHLPQLAGMTPQHLLEYAEGMLFADSHWAPQSAYYTEGVRVVPFEMVLRWFGIRRKTNATEAKPDDPPMPVSEIIRVYSQDMKLIYGR